MSERKRLKNKFSVAEPYNTKSNYPGFYLIKEVTETGSTCKLNLDFEKAGKIIWDTPNKSFGSETY